MCFSGRRRYDNQHSGLYVIYKSKLTNIQVMKQSDEIPHVIRVSLLKASVDLYNRPDWVALKPLLLLQFLLPSNSF